MRTCVLGFWILVVAVTSATAQERARIRPLTPRPTIQDSISQRPTLLPEVVRSGKLRVVRIPKTTLEIQRHSGEFAEWSYTWTFSSPQSLRFRWATQEAGVEKGMWQVSDQPFAGDDIAPDGLIRWGSIAQVPALGKVSVFDINFTQFAPSSPPSSPRKYYVRVIPFGSGWDPAGAPSLPVTVTYQQPGPMTIFTDLPVSIYEQDWDNDGLPDLHEYYLAEQFKPGFIFDSDEGNRRHYEPVVLFQVRPAGCIGSECPKPIRVWIKYMMLFAEDGGYGPSSDCFDEHNGDNQPIDVKIQSDDGESWNAQSWSLVEVVNSDYKWPGSSVEFWYDQLGRQTHPVIYLSAHKHHQYFGTFNDEEDSPYSGFGCNDDVNGEGARMFANLLSPEQRPNNVGEPGAHDAGHFIGDLAPFGYPGENAWSDKPFKGGLGDDGGDTSSLKEGWMDHGFEIRD